MRISEYGFRIGNSDAFINRELMKASLSYSGIHSGATSKQGARASLPA